MRVNCNIICFIIVDGDIPHMNVKSIILLFWIVLLSYYDNSSKCTYKKRLKFFIIEKNMSCHTTIEVFFKCDLLSFFIFYFRGKLRCNLYFKNLWPIIFQSNFGMTSEILFLLFSQILFESHFLMKRKRTIFASNQRMERMNNLFYKKY